MLYWEVVADSSRNWRPPVRPVEVLAAHVVVAPSRSAASVGFAKFEQFVLRHPQRQEGEGAYPEVVILRPLVLGNSPMIEAEVAASPMSLKERVVLFPAAAT